MAAEKNRSTIAAWVAKAPTARIVETTRERGRWVTQAIENGVLKYEETTFGDDEPRLNLMAAWCERQTKRGEARPVVKVPVPQRTVRKMRN